MRRIPACAILLLAFMSAACGVRPRSWGTIFIPPGRPITLGYAFAPSGSSEVPVNWNAIEAAARAAGPIIGHSLQLKPLAVGCAAHDPAKATQSLANLSQFTGVIGPNCSAECVYAEGVLYKQRRTMITPACTAAAVVQQGFPNVFRLAWDDNDQAVLAAEFAYTKLHKRRAVLIGDGTVYALSMDTAFKGQFRSLGGSVVAQETTGGSRVSSDLVKQVLASHAEVAFVAVTAPKAATLVSDFAQRLPSLLVMSGDTVLQQSVASCDKGSPQATAPNLPANVYAGVGLTQLGSSWTSELDRARRSHCLQMQPEAEDAIRLFSEALRTVAKRRRDGSLVISLQALRDAIARERLAGQSGMIRFDPFGERTSGTGAVLYQDQRGVLRTVASLKNGDKQ